MFIKYKFYSKDIFTILPSITGTSMRLLLKYDENPNKYYFTRYLIYTDNEDLYKKVWGDKNYKDLEKFGLDTFVGLFSIASSFNTFWLEQLNKILLLRCDYYNREGMSMAMSYGNLPLSEFYNQFCKIDTGILVHSMRHKSIFKFAVKNYPNIFHPSHRDSHTLFKEAIKSTINHGSNTYYYFIREGYKVNEEILELALSKPKLYYELFESGIKEGINLTKCLNDACSNKNREIAEFLLSKGAIPEGRKMSRKSLKFFWRNFPNFTWEGDEEENEDEELWFPTSVEHICPGCGYNTDIEYETEY